MVKVVSEPAVRQSSESAATVPEPVEVTAAPVRPAATSTGTIAEKSDLEAAEGNVKPVESTGSPAAAAESPASRARRKPAKTGAALSLNSIMQEEETKKVEKQAVVIEDAIPDDEVLLNAWKTVPAEYASSPRLANTLQNADVSVEMKDGYKVLTFKVSNDAQEKWIRANRLMDLEGNLQKKVGSSKLRLEVGVVPMADKGVQPYTDQEKATALMGQNGEVQNLIKDFGLETK